LLRPDLHPRVPELKREHLADRPGAAAADVVDLAGLAPLEREPVRPDHLADVGPVALTREVAVVDHRLVLFRLDQRDLAGDGARRMTIGRRTAPRGGRSDRAGRR